MLKKEKEIIHEEGKKSNRSVSESKLDWQHQKELQAKQRKKENHLKKVEDEITRLEEDQAKLQEEMVLPEIATDVAKLTELSKKQDEITCSLEKLYEEWETLC